MSLTTSEHLRRSLLLKLDIWFKIQRWSNSVLYSSILDIFQIMIWIFRVLWRSSRCSTALLFIPISRDSILIHAINHQNYLQPNIRPHPSFETWPQQPYSAAPAQSEATSSTPYSKTKAPLFSLLSKPFPADYPTSPNHHPLHLTSNLSSNPTPRNGPPCFRNSTLPLPRFSTR